MLSNKEIVCPENLLKVAKNKKDVTAGIVNAGKPLPMHSAMEAVKENLITPIFIGDENEIKKNAEQLKWDISKYEIINETVDRCPDMFCRDVLHSLLDEHRDGAVDQSKRIFRAITLAVWLETFGLSIDSG